MKAEDYLAHHFSIPQVLRYRPITILVVAVSYVLLAKISFLMTIDPGSVSPIFLPAGLALASILILGRRAIAGIFLGSFYSNTFLNFGISHYKEIFLSPHFLSSFYIAIGSIIASTTASIILNRLCKKGHLLSKGKNVLFLLILGPAIFSTITSLVGVTSFYIEGAVAADQFWYTYKTWWFGDSVGIILVTPLILSWALKDAFSINKFNSLELILFGLITILVCIGVFFRYNELKYLIMPLLFWSAYRFPVQITTLVISIISLFAIVTTTLGIGPFNEERINDSILFLDLFLSTISICSIFLSGIISERKKGEDLIKTSEKNLRKNQILLESTLESPKNFNIFSIGKNYEYLSFNRQHHHSMKILYGTEIAIGKKIHDCIFDYEKRNKALEILSKAFLGESITTVSYFDVNSSYWEFRTSPIVNQDEGIIGATVISTDITQKMKDEEALKKSEEKYRNIFETIQDVIFQTDINGVFTDLSPSVKGLCGYAAEELIGKHISFLQADGVNDNTIVELVNELSVINNCERQIKTKSGSIRQISLSAKMIFDIFGDKLHINAIARDITQRKENEKEIALQNQKLQIQNKELEQFAYITSHDLQEPLITLKFFSELIKNQFPNTIDEEVKQYLEFILESSDRMQKLVKGLLDYSRIGNQTELKEIDCNDVVNEAIDSLSDSIREVNCKITVENLPVLNSYSVELAELFQYLISNCIKFRKIDVPLIITIGAKLIGDNWEFTVKDNGIGIEEQNKEKAFIIFKRLNDREDYPGIGIGLAICKKIIALHNGNIWIESSLGLGTTIHFTIPKKIN